MDSDKIRTAIEEALCASVNGIQVPGIVDAAVCKVAVSAAPLQQLAAELEQHGHGEITLSAEVELLLRLSNSDVLKSIEGTDFRVTVDADGNDLRAVASSEKDWELAWERGLEPIKESAVQGMKKDVWNMDASLAEDSYTFQAAMVLFASELVGPYVDRIVTFLGYPPDLVQVMAARLQESQIWDGDEVHCERWFDPQKGVASFIMDLMVAEGKFVRKWSEEKNQFVYHLLDIPEAWTMTNKAENALHRAVAAYREGHPVVVLSDEGATLHGEDFLRAVRDLSMPLEARVIRGIPKAEFEASDWPEILEAARQVFLKNAWPDGPHDAEP